MLIALALSNANTLNPQLAKLTMAFSVNVSNARHVLEHEASCVLGAITVRVLSVPVAVTFC